MKKHAFDKLESDPAKRKKYYQDEIKKLTLEKNLLTKDKSDAMKNVQLVAKSVTHINENLEENRAKNAYTHEQMQLA